MFPPQKIRGICWALADVKPVPRTHTGKQLDIEMDMEFVPIQTRIAS